MCAFCFVCDQALGWQRNGGFWEWSSLGDVDAAEEADGSRLQTVPNEEEIDFVRRAREMLHEAAVELEVASQNSGTRPKANATT